MKLSCYRGMLSRSIVLNRTPENLTFVVFAFVPQLVFPYNFFLAYVKTNRIRKYVSVIVWYCLELMDMKIYLTTISSFYIMFSFQKLIVFIVKYMLFVILIVLDFQHLINVPTASHIYWTIDTVQFCEMGKTKILMTTRRKGFTDS